MVCWVVPDHTKVSPYFKKMKNIIETYGFSYFQPRYTLPHQNKHNEITLLLQLGLGQGDHDSDLQGHCNKFVGICLSYMESSHFREQLEKDTKITEPSSQTHYW